MNSSINKWKKEIKFTKLSSKAMAEIFEEMREKMNLKNMPILAKLKEMIESEILEEAQEIVEYDMVMNFKQIKIE